MTAFLPSFNLLRLLTYGRCRPFGGALLLIFVFHSFVLAKPPYERLISQAKALNATARGTIYSWVELVATNTATENNKKLLEANDFFNRRLNFSNDLAVWGLKDYWATPLESLAKGQGDCEDFALAKYVTLIEMGVPEIRLRLVYVQAKMPSGVQAHMVLAYYPSPNADPLILDNISSAILPASQRTDLSPVFSFNASSLWVGGQSKGDSTTRLSQWRAVLQRMNEQGFLSPKKMTKGTQL